MRLPGALLGALLAAPLAGCSGALYSQYDFRSGQAERTVPPAQAGSRAAGRSTDGAPGAGRWTDGAPGAAGAPDAAAMTGWSKGEVLAALGPPVEVLPLAAGDVFVYRRRLTDVDVLNLNTGLLTGLFVPLYASIRGRLRDDVLFVQFDAAGRVTSLSERGA